jgi:hypothetical protein
MIELLQTYQNDLIIIGILAIEIILLTILGTSVLRRSRSLANVYFSIVFFVVVFLSALNIAIRVLGIYIENNYLTAETSIVQIYLDLIAIVTASMIDIPIIYGAGFFIINYGEKFYRDRKLYLVFILIIIIISGLIIGSRFLPESMHWGIEFHDVEVFDEFFFINIPLAILVGVITLLFFILDLILLIRIFPDTQTRVQKVKLVILMIALFTYIFGLGNLILVDMHLVDKSIVPNRPIWNYLFITSVLFLVSVLSLYISVTRRRKKVEIPTEGEDISD